MKPSQLQSAYVLHRRPYRETSFLVELFTPEYGRLSAVIKGVRKARSQVPGLLQPFVPLIVSWTGKNELMTLTHVENKAEVKSLQGECLFAGFYLNELLLCLLQKWDAHPNLYSLYENALVALQGPILQEKTLRSFEKNLLEELGYGLLSKSHASLHNTFSTDCYYRFVIDQGFILIDINDPTQLPINVFSGSSLLAIAREDWQDESVLQAAKRLTRLVLGPLLGNRPIYSRKLFIKVGSSSE